MDIFDLTAAVLGAAKREDAESVARALYYRDYDRGVRRDPRIKPPTPWEDLTEHTKNIWRGAISRG